MSRPAGHSAATNQRQSLANLVADMTGLATVVGRPELPTLANQDALIGQPGRRPPSNLATVVGQPGLPTLAELATVVGQPGRHVWSTLVAARWPA